MQKLAQEVRDPASLCAKCYFLHVSSYIPNSKYVECNMGLSENTVPLKTQWLMIIIPLKWLSSEVNPNFPDRKPYKSPFPCSNPYN